MSLLTRKIYCNATPLDRPLSACSAEYKCSTSVFLHVNSGKKEQKTTNLPEKSFKVQPGYQMSIQLTKWPVNCKHQISLGDYKNLQLSDKMRMSPMGMKVKCEDQLIRHSVLGFLSETKIRYVRMSQARYNKILTRTGTILLNFLQILFLYKKCVKILGRTE